MSKLKKQTTDPEQKMYCENTCRLKFETFYDIFNIIQTLF